MSGTDSCENCSKYSNNKGFYCVCMDTQMFSFNFYPYVNEND